MSKRHSVGVAVGAGPTLLYSYGGRVKRIPASNQKLLLSTALLDRLGPRHRIATVAAARRVRKGVVKGDLWIEGRGDPTVTADESSYWGGVRSTTLVSLARRVKRAGIDVIQGRVLGARGFMAHDLDAPGWQPYVPGRYVQLPSALVLRGNYATRSHPERAVAKALTAMLKRVGVRVEGRPGAGPPPRRLSTVTSIRSRPLEEIVSFMNKTSNNFFAETLGKLLGAVEFGRPGTIAKGARAIEAWARRAGVEVVARDASGLSYDNRVSPVGLVRLLGVARDEPWGKTLIRGLPVPGEGTLSARLAGLPVRAKTGSLFNGASALSGWVRSRNGRLLEFSILARNAPATIEDRIARILARARIATPEKKHRVCTTS